MKGVDVVGFDDSTIDVSFAIGKHCATLLEQNAASSNTVLKIRMLIDSIDSIDLIIANIDDIVCTRVYVVEKLLFNG